MRRPQQETGETIWVVSDPTPFGGYQLSIQVGPDRSFTPDDPYAYARTAVAAIERACFESAVARQIHKVSKKHKGNDDGDPYAAFLVLKELRAAHPPLDDTATAPLTFTPIVAGAPGRNFAPSVHIAVDSVPFCQWDRASVYRHVGHVLAVDVVATLDATYRRVIREQFGDGIDAAAMVGDLASYRDPEPEEQ